MSIYAQAPSGNLEMNQMIAVDSSSGDVAAPADVETARAKNKQEGGSLTDFLVRGSSAAPGNGTTAELRASIANFKRTVSAPPGRGMCASTGCCKYLCNICCFPCSFFPRCSAGCMFALVIMLFVGGSITINELCKLDNELKSAASEFQKVLAEQESRQTLTDKYATNELTSRSTPACFKDHCNNIDWFPCELYTTSLEPSLKDHVYTYSSDKRAECAMVPMPLLYSDLGGDGSNGETIEIFVKRMRQKNQVARKALWVLQGGPGAPSVAMESIMEAAYVELEDTDVYTFDHRGTGRSTPMSCVAAQSLTKNSEAGLSLGPDEVAHCYQALDGQFTTPNAHTGFSVTAAANDLFRAIAMFNDHQETSVYGVSYGTFLVNRYMQVAANNDPSAVTPQAKNIILDGVVSSSGGEHQYGRMSFRYWALNFEGVGRDFFNACGLDAYCSQYLGTGDQPYQTVVTLYDKLANGHCQQLQDVGVSAGILSTISAMLIRDHSSRMILPAVIFRLNRCNNYDRGFLISFFRLLGDDLLHPSLGPRGTNPDVPLDNNELLYEGIKFSELWTLSPLNITRDTFAQEAAATHFEGSQEAARQLSMALGGCTEGARTCTGRKYTYARDRFFDTFPATKSNVLVMNGLLDPQTPAQSGDVQYAGIEVHGGAKKWKANFPGSTHCTVAVSPVKSKPSWQKSKLLLTSAPEEGLPCGMQMLLKFVSDPTQDPAAQANCISDMKAINFGQDIPATLGLPTDPFDGVSATTAQLIMIETVAQTGLWMTFALFTLPCCCFYFCLIHYRLKTEGQICCC